MSDDIDNFMADRGHPYMTPSEREAAEAEMARSTPVDRPAPTPTAAPRYFHIKTDGTTPTWTIIAARPCDAWRLWVDHEDASGFLDGEGHGDVDTEAPSFSLDEMTAEYAASRMVDDDGTRRPLTECAIGSVFCSEY